MRRTCSAVRTSSFLYVSDCHHFACAAWGENAATGVKIRASAATAHAAIAENEVSDFMLTTGGLRPSGRSRLLPWLQLDTVTRMSLAAHAEATPAAVRPRRRWPAGRAAGSPIPRCYPASKLRK